MSRAWAAWQMAVPQRIALPGRVEGSEKAVAGCRDFVSLEAFQLRSDQAIVRVEQLPPGDGRRARRHVGWNQRCR